MLALHSNDFSLLRTKLKVKMKPKVKTQQNSQNFRTMDMRIGLFSPVWAIRNKNRILADPPLTMPVTSACTRAICRGYRADGPGDEVAILAFFPHEVCSSFRIFVDLWSDLPFYWLERGNVSWTEPCQRLVKQDWKQNRSRRHRKMGKSNHSHKALSLKQRIKDEQLFCWW